MSRKTNAPHSRPAGIGLRLPELALLLLPFIALTPNFFIIPDIAYQGNATLEVALAWTVTAFLGLALVILFLSDRPPALTRDQLLLIAPLGALLLWQLVSLIWSPDWAEGVRVGSIWFGFGVIFTTGLLTLTAAGTTRLFYALTALVLILAASQAFEYQSYGGEMLGVFFSHGITTELLALILPLQLAFYLTTPRRAAAIISIAAAAAGGAAIVLTLRRGAMLGLLLAFVLLAVAVFRGWLKPAERWRTIAIGAAIILFLAGPLLFKRDYFMARMRSAFEIQTAHVGRVTDVGLTSRLTKWLTAWEMGKQHALLGVGHGGFTSAYSEARRAFIENPRYERVASAAEAEDFDEIRSPLAHNEYLQIFAELGLVGLLLFIAFWYGVGRRLWRARRSEEAVWVIGALGGLLAFAVSSGMSAFSFRYAPGTIIAACVAAIGCAAVRRGEVAAATPAPSVKLPRWAVIGGLTLLTIVGLATILRSRDVLASQKAQSQIDFRFSLESTAINESLIRRYEQALLIDPENSGAHLGLGLLLYQMKRPAEAIPHAEFALQHSYNRPYAYLLLAFAHEATGDPARAQQIVAQCLASYPRSLVTRAYNIELLQKMSKTGLAVSEQHILDKQDFRNGRSWVLALRLKDAEAAAAAKRDNLIPPGELEPMLVRGLVQARAYHYLK